MSDQEILHIFVEIAEAGRGRHGGFLMSFAEAVMRADPANFALMRPVALALISKYGLDKYLDNFGNVYYEGPEDPESRREDDPANSHGRP